MQELLTNLTRLSHEFGVERYVLGGGGNTSVKDGDLLWVKPSGGTLRDMTAERFVCLDRRAIEGLFAADLPTESRAREAAVKEWMGRTVVSGSEGRPSVEAPLHSILPGRYVVHTHPVLVNGLTCGVRGEEACTKLFPEAMWVGYVDPGYTLCAHVRKALAQFCGAHGRAPTLVFLENHGLFVSADTPEEIRALYATVMRALEQVYAQAGVATALCVGIPPEGAGERMRRAWRNALGEEEGGGVMVAVSGIFPVFRGPLTPDHVVYAGAFACRGGVERGSLRAFRAAHGYYPRVVDGGDAVFGVGATTAAATLALAFARDAAMVEQLAAAFGGARYMDDRARKFIENWEVEQYRRQVTTGSV